MASRKREQQAEQEIVVKAPKVEEVGFLGLDDQELTEFQQTELRNTLNAILGKIGGILQIEKDTLEDWIEDRTSTVIDESSSSMFAVAALTISDPEYKYQLLSCSELKDVFLQLTRFLAEMDV